MQNGITFEIKISGEMNSEMLATLLSTMSNLQPNQATVQQIKTAEKSEQEVPASKRPKKESIKVVELAEKKQPTVDFSEEPTAEEASVESEDLTPDYTFEQVRAKAVAISKSGKKEQVQAALKKLGREKTPELTPDQYNEFMELLDKIN